MNYWCRVTGLGGIHKVGPYNSFDNAKKAAEVILLSGVWVTPPSPPIPTLLFPHTIDTVQAVSDQDIINYGL